MESQENYNKQHQHTGIDSQKIQEKNIGFSDILNNNSSTEKHGFLPKLSGTSTTFLNGSGAFSGITASGITGVLPVANGGTGATTILGANIPLIVGTDRKTAQTNVVALATYTVGASDESFIVSANVNVTVSTNHSFSVYCTYTDETNTARQLAFQFTQLGGALITLITNVTGVGAYESVPYHIRAKAGTGVTVNTAGTVTTVTYNVEEIITRYK